MGARILIVDPRPLLRAGLSSLLRADAQVTEAADAAQALALLRGPPYAAVILSTELPERAALVAAARSRGAAWLVGLSAHPGPVEAGLDAQVSLADPAHQVLAAVQTGLAQHRSAPDLEPLSPDDEVVLQLLAGGADVPTLSAALERPWADVQRLLRDLRRKLRAEHLAALVSADPGAPGPARRVA